jgi:tetratricopeptide (TPR) repeat protein
MTIASQERDRYTQLFGAHMHRYIDHYVAFARDHARQHFLIDAEIGNIRNALQQSLRFSRPDAFIGGVDALQPYLQARGRFGESVEYLQRSLILQRKRTARVTPDALIRALASLGTALEMQGQYAAAMHHLRRGLRLARRHRDEQAEIQMLRTLGMAQMNSGEGRKALGTLRHATALADRHDLRHELPALLLVRARIHQQIGQPDEADECCALGLELVQHSPDLSLRAALLNARGTLAGMRGDLETAERYLRESLALAQQAQNPERVATASWNLGNILYFLGRAKEAVREYRSGLVAARRIGHQSLACGILISLGVIVSESGSEGMAEAVAYWLEAAAIGREIGQLERVSGAVSNLGAWASREGRDVDALRYFDESLAIARKLKSPWTISTVLVERGRHHVLFKRWDAAARDFRRAIRIADAAQVADKKADAEFGLAQVQLQRGRPAEARRLAERSLATFDAMPHPEAANVRAWLASHYGDRS